MVKNGQKWSKMVKNGQKWSKMVKTVGVKIGGKKCFKKMVKIVREVVKIVREVVKIVREWVKIVPPPHFSKVIFIPRVQ